MIVRRNGRIGWTIGKCADAPIDFADAPNALYFIRMLRHICTKNEMTRIIFTSTIHFFLFICLIFQSLKVDGQCENRMLHFDGSNTNYVTIQQPFTYNNDYTLEFWFKPSSNPVSPCGNGQLFSFFSSISNYFGMTYCNGNLEIFGSNTCPALTVIQSGVSPTWHHLAITRQVGLTTIIFNGTAIFTTNCPYNIKDDLSLGAFGAPGSGPTFLGSMDEIRLWNVHLNAAQILQSMHCVVPFNHPDLRAYYRADQGDANDPTGNPANNNSAILDLVDITSNHVDGMLNNFSLIGQSSNFICATSPIVYPHFNNITPFISDYTTQSSPVDSICSGEPIHLCLKDSLGVPITYSSQIDTVIWQYNKGNGWLDFSSNTFQGFCFPIAPGEITLDCDTASLGFENWKIRASIDVSNASGDTCTYHTQSTSLKIYCDLQATLNGQTNYTNDLLCENDLVDFSMSISTPYSFIQAPVSGIQIDWSYTDASGTYNLTLYQNQTSILYNSVTVPSGPAYFTVGITDNRIGKKIVLRKYFTVDPMPQCGTIDLIPDPGILKQLSTTPLIYEICPGEDATLNMVTPFANCIPTWEYQLGNALLWIPMGSTNTLQNTNIIPANFWPSGTQKIFFRIKCAPIQSPSGCDPCYSNVIEVRLKAIPPAPIVNGQNYVCFGGTTPLSVTNPSPQTIYNWYCNGNWVATDTSYQATTGGCYWVTATDNCYSIPSSKHCLDVCEITPIISCPLAPNACPAPGETIYLSGCASSSTCAGALTYQWAWDSGTVVSTNGCALAHIPLPSGTTYTLTVTNSLTGCSATTSSTIIPCP